MNQYQRIGAALLLIIAVIVVSACSSKKTSQPIDPPPEDLTVHAPITVEDATAAGVGTDLYVLDPSQFVVPLNVRLPQSEGPAKQALSYMVQGGPAEALLPDGFTPLLPEGTEVIGMNIIPDKQVAIIDFSAAFTDYPAARERDILEGLTWTMTQFPTINRVEIWVEGKPLKEMPIGKTPLTEGLTRSMGINLERVEGVNLSRANAVTVYFQNYHDQLQAYWVPVTRIVPQTDNLAMAAVEQLIKGPSASSSLYQVMQPNTQILQLTADEGLYTVKFGESLLEGGEAVPAEVLQSVILSLSETAAARQVMFQIDGRSELLSTDDSNYSQPVSRPEKVNALEI